MPRAKSSSRQLSRNLSTHSSLDSIINFLLKAMFSINSKLLLAGLMLVAFDVGINQIRNSFITDLDVRHSTSLPSTFFGKVGATSFDCNELNIRKPPRFGKRNAYIDKYRTNTNCVDRQRREFHIRDNPKPTINSENLNTLLARLFWIFSDDEARRSRIADPVGLVVQSSQSQQQTPYLDRLAKGSATTDLMNIIKQFNQLTEPQLKDTKDMPVGDQMTGTKNGISSTSHKESSPFFYRLPNRPLFSEDMLPV